MKILLGSNSPRRSQLLKEMDLPFEKVSIHCEEQSRFTDPKKIALDIAEQKSSAYLSLKENELLITADTIVNLDKQVLHKPKDAEDARKMLSALSAKKHSVLTAVYLRTNKLARSFVEETEVVFNSLSEEEISYYIENYKPFDKAGAYGIQEWLGISKVQAINGCYFNVVGLPCARLFEYLIKYYPKYVAENYNPS